MTQSVAAEFADFNNSIRKFKEFVSRQKGFQDETFKPEFYKILEKMRIEIDNYVIADYKIKFIEWVLSDLVYGIDSMSFNTNKDVNSKIKSAFKNAIRAEIKNEFEHELIRYPFVFNEIKQINWQWKYRKILVVLFSLRHLGAFDESTAEKDISNLKDLIFKSAPSLWENTDVEGSFDDITRIWNRIMETPNKAMGEREDEAFLSREKASVKHLQKFSDELKKLLKHV